jgi:hypothetical protein
MLPQQFIAVQKHQDIGIKGTLFFDSPSKRVYIKCMRLGIIREAPCNDI